MIRVLHIVSNMSSFGGVQQVLMNYYRAMDRNKIQFDFVVQTADEDIFIREIRELGGKIYVVTPISKSVFAFQKDLANILDKNPGYKIVHAHMNFHNIVALKTAKKSNIPVRISHSHNNYKASSFHVEVMRKAFRVLLPFFATDYWACSKIAAVWLHGKSASRKIKIIYNAIDFSNFKFNNEKRMSIRKTLGIEDKYALICVASLNEAKNQAYTIDVFKEFTRQVSDSVVIFLGEGELKSKLIEKAESYGLANSALFLGAVRNVYDYLSAADCLILNSKGEGLPLVTVEAQKSGLPCLVSYATPKEADCTGHVFYADNNRPPEFWANELKKIKENFSIDRSQVIIDNYDVKVQAKLLGDTYAALTRNERV